MSGFNVSNEKETIWSFTQEEIEKRWQLHKKFDPIQRLFGDKKSGKLSVQESQRNVAWLKKIHPNGMQ